VFMLQYRTFWIWNKIWFWDWLAEFF